MADSFERLFEPGQTIVVGQGGGFAAETVRRLVAAKSRLRGSRIICGMGDPLLLELPETALRTMFPSGAISSETTIKERNIEYRRTSLFDFASDLAGQGAGDIVIARVSRPRDGFFSMAFNADYILPAVRSGKLLVLESCPDAPWLGAHIAVDDPRIAAVIDGPPAFGRMRPEAVAPSPAPFAQNLAATLKPLLQRAEAIQVGLGSWTRGLGNILAGSGIAVHSGLVDSWLLDALDHDPLSISTIRSSAILAHPTVCRLAEDLFKQDRLLLEGATFIHSPETLGRINGLLAVNSVWQVDLSGRGNSEKLVNTDGSVTFGGLGGLPDFAKAAAAQPDGRSILCLRSMDQAGRSRVVNRLTEDCVSLSEKQVDIIVTENGVADIRGLETHRRRALIAQNLVAPSSAETLPTP